MKFAKLLLIAGGLLGSVEVYAAPTTPVAYCKSLAAASCEVLNVDSAGSGVVLIKYCLNRALHLKAIQYSVSANVTTPSASKDQYYLIVDSTSTTIYTSLESIVDAVTGANCRQ